MYSFENRCEQEPGLALGDGARAVFLAATSPRGASQPEALNSLLDYIVLGKADGDLPERVDERVREVIGSTEWRREYMLLEWRDQENVEKGRKEGVENFGRLIAALMAQGRTDDVVKAASDPDERERLAAEFGIEMLGSRRS